MSDTTKLDTLMHLLAEQEGWPAYHAAIIAKQHQAQERLLNAVALELNLQQVYALVGEVRAFGRVLGIPGELAALAVAARAAEAEGKTGTTPHGRPSATARARKAATV